MKDFWFWFEWNNLFEELQDFHRIQHDMVEFTDRRFEWMIEKALKLVVARLHGPTTTIVGPRNRHLITNNE